MNQSLIEYLWLYQRTVKGDQGTALNVTNDSLH